MFLMKSLKLIYNMLLRSYISNRLKRRRIKKIESSTHSTLSLKILFDSKTSFEGYNKIGEANVCSSTIGFGTYFISGDLRNSVIGRFCSIGNNVIVITSNHPSDFVSTYPGFFKTQNKGIYNFETNLSFNEHKLTADGHSIVIGNDVWIGDNVTFLGGVSIGDGAIIGANALVTKDVPPYCVVGGVPAKVIKTRFNVNLIDRLMSIKWWNWDLERLNRYSMYFSNVEMLLQKIDEESVNETQE